MNKDDRSLEQVLGRIELRLTNLEAVYTTQRKHMSQIKQDVRRIMNDLEAIRAGEYCILFDQQAALTQAIPNFVTTMKTLSEDLNKALARVEAQANLLAALNGQPDGP